MLTELPHFWSILEHGLIHTRSILVFVVLLPTGISPKVSQKPLRSLREWYVVRKDYNDLDECGDEEDGQLDFVSSLSV